jgi:hypothetical protein
MSGGTMTKKTFRFTKRMLIILSAALPLFLVFFLEIGLKGTTHF